jgi:hypothetical protein
VKRRFGGVCDLETRSRIDGSRLCFRSLDHPLRQVDAVNAVAALREEKRERPGSAPQIRNARRWGREHPTEQIEPRAAHTRVLQPMISLLVEPGSFTIPELGRVNVGDLHDSLSELPSRPHPVA